jgi:two-component system sensor histidine kinase DesK
VNETDNSRDGQGEGERTNPLPSLRAAGTFNRRTDRVRWVDFIWLVYSIFYLIEPIERHSLRGWVQFALFYAVFLAIYTTMVMARTVWLGRVALLALAVLGLLSVPSNPGTMGVIIYAAAFLPFLFNRVAVVIPLLITLCTVVALEGWLMHLSPWNWGICLLIALVVGGTNVIFAEQKRANQKLGLANEEITHLAKVAERERIARDLHDVLGHTLSVVVLKSELAGRLIDRDPQRARTEMREVELIARKALSEVRETIRGYRAEGLAAEIDRAQKTLEAAGVILECKAKPPVLRATEETVLSLIVREAVTNIVRHAQANHCRLEFTKSETGTSLTVEDDGRGGIREEGNGLRGMRERVESLGGWLKIDSVQGTRLVIEIPQTTTAGQA